MSNGIRKPRVAESEVPKISEMVRSEGWEFYKIGMEKIIKEVTDVCVDPATPLENVKELRGQIYGMKLLINIAEEINREHIGSMRSINEPETDEKVVGIEPS